MKKAVSLYAVLISIAMLALTIIILCLTGCTTTHKAVSKSSRQVDSSGNTVNQVNRIASIDSLHSVKAAEFAHVTGDSTYRRKVVEDVIEWIAPNDKALLTSRQKLFRGDSLTAFGNGLLPLDLLFLRQTRRVTYESGNKKTEELTGANRVDTTHVNKTYANSINNTSTATVNSTMQEMNKTIDRTSWLHLLWLLLIPAAYIIYKKQVNPQWSIIASLKKIIH